MQQALRDAQQQRARAVFESMGEKERQRARWGVEDAAEVLIGKARREDARQWSTLPATALKLNSNVPVLVLLYSYLICTGTGTYGTRVPGYCSIHGEL